MSGDYQSPDNYEVEWPFNACSDPYACGHFPAGIVTNVPFDQET